MDSDNRSDQPLARAPPASHRPRPAMGIVRLRGEVIAQAVRPHAPSKMSGTLRSPELLLIEATGVDASPASWETETDRGW